MKIRDVMRKNPITVDPRTLLVDARELMPKHKIQRLPVVKKKKLVGLLTRSMLLEAAPSPANMLNIHELAYLHTKMQVKDIMVTDPVTVHPDMSVAQALLLGQEKGIGGFPVVEKGELVGMASEDDIVRVMARLLGLREEGVGLTIEGPKMSLDELNEILSIVNLHKAPVLSMMTLPRPEKEDWLIFIRIKTEDATTVVEEIEKEGFNVTYIG